MSALLARARSISPAAVWFPALALVVAGPLLAFSGYLMLLDYPAGPEFPKFSWFPLPSSGDIGNSTPLLVIERFLRWVHVYLPDKVLLLAPILLGGIGIYRFTRRHLDVGPLPALFGGTLFAINPFVLDRYLAGHVHFLLAYGLLPWALPPLVRAVDEPSLRRAVPLAMWLFVLGIVDLHIMGIYGLLVLVAIAFARTSLLRRIGMAAGTSALALLLSAFWVLPAIFATQGQGIGSADLEVYASRPRGYGVLPTLLSMYGFWRDEFVGPAQRIPALYLLLIPILGLATLGVMTLLAPGRRRRFAGALGVSALLALVLAAGISFPPTAGGFRWLFDHVPLMGVYREPQKFVALVVLALAVFGAAGSRILSSRHAAGVGWFRNAIPPVVGVVAVLAYGYTMLGGFWGQVSLTRYPNDWYEVESILRAHSPGRVLVVPWHLYAVWTFSDDRIVATPAGSFFSSEVISAREAGFEIVPTQSADPFTIYAQQLIEKRESVRSFGHLVAPLSVRYVVSLKEVDSWEYQFLHRQRDLSLAYEGERLVLFENEAYQEEHLQLTGRDEIEGLADIVGTIEEARVTGRLYESPALRAPSQYIAAPLVRSLPFWREEGPVDGDFLLTGGRCTDGWLLDDERPLCHLGAAAAFETAGPAVLWRPLLGFRLMGAIGGTLVLLGSSYWVRRDQRKT